MRNKLLLIVLVLMFVFVGPVAAQDGEPEEPVSVEVVDEAEEGSTEEDGVSLPDLGGQLSSLVMIVGIGALFVVTNETAFERFIAVPVINQYLPKAKAYQPFMVAVLCVAVAWAFQLDLLEALAAYTDAFQAPGGDGGIFGTGLVGALLAMALHDKNKSDSTEDAEGDVE